MKNFLSHPLVKQLSGAVVGSTIALVLYGVYTVVAPPVISFMDSTVRALHGSAPEYSDAEREERQDLIVERAKEIASRLLADKQ